MNGTGDKKRAGLILSLVALVVLALGIIVFVPLNTYAENYGYVNAYSNNFNDTFTDNDYGGSNDNNSNNNDEPDVTTRNASSVGSTSATLNGRVDGNGFSTRVWFEYGTSRSLNDETSERSYGSGTTGFSIRLSGLRRDTTYYFRAVAENREGTDYGSILSFRTDDRNDNDDNASEDSAAPTTITIPATFVGNTSAQLNSLISTSSDDLTYAWFEWGTNINLDNKTIATPFRSLSSVEHKIVISGLAPGETYYFRAVAENAVWRNNGSILTFRTTGGQSVAQNILRPPVTPAASATTDNSPPKAEPETETDTQTGAVLGTNVSTLSFFPTSFSGWLLAIILILIIAILGKKLADASPNQRQVEH